MSNKIPIPGTESVAGIVVPATGELGDGRLLPEATEPKGQEEAGIPATTDVGGTQVPATTEDGGVVVPAEKTENVAYGATEVIPDSTNLSGTEIPATESVAGVVMPKTTEVYGAMDFLGQYTPYILAGLLGLLGYLMYRKK